MCLLCVLDNLNIFTLYLKDNNNYDNKKKNYERRGEEGGKRRER